ncbi:hypothetical protein POSPLADRAFT_1152738 [Postia placenta MAD-698-R-SB12]|uniref:DUF6534 domain-containing protein n=1 Tax=Postia placenta MAD-698-R-SB12 TaxID=670580 RepID=A0A1X6MQL5_9APHY|nr:hypothetical protein POSPLADRAFT_1152738 [Postia placenta MAD-698-R-SB12]OSX58569.1 hypothetical protein POSPLADRAFT_1152738 [Postia placenta MAD-698-R-SB12]
MCYVRDYPEDLIWLKSLVFILALSKCTELRHFTYGVSSTGAVKYLLALLHAHYMDPWAVCHMMHWNVLTTTVVLARCIGPCILCKLRYRVTMRSACVLLKLNRLIHRIRSPAIPALYIKLRVGASIQPFTASVTDVCITVMLCWVLHTENNGLAYTNSLLRTLMIYAIGRGILTTALQIGQAVSYVASSPDAFYWSMFHFPGSKGMRKSIMELQVIHDHIRKYSIGQGYTTTRYGQGDGKPIVQARDHIMGIFCRTDELLRLPWNPTRSAMDRYGIQKIVVDSTCACMVPRCTKGRC